MLPKNILIRPETPADYNVVFDLNATAFGQDNESKLIDALRKSTAFIEELSLVAVVGDELVGHILFTHIQILRADHITPSLALAPMAVKPGFQKQGVGSLLIAKGILEATRLGHQSIIVLGHNHYYPKFGFVPAKKWEIKAPFDVPDSAFMGMELIPGALKNAAGMVVYPKEFEEV